MERHYLLMTRRKGRKVKQELATILTLDHYDFAKGYNHIAMALILLAIVALGLTLKYGGNG